MALTVSTLISDARDRAYPYGQVAFGAADVPLMRILGSMDYNLVMKTARSAPWLISTAASNLTMDLSTNASGYALTSAIAYSDFVHIGTEGSSDEYTPITIVGEKSFDQGNTGNPAAIVRGSTFYPIDPGGQRWSTSTEHSFYRTGDEVAYRYIAAPTRPTALTDTLTMPDFCQEYFIQSLVSHLYAVNNAPDRLVQLALQREEQLRRNLYLHISKSRDTRWHGQGGGLTGSE